MASAITAASTEQNTVSFVDNFWTAIMTWSQDELTRIDTAMTLLETVDHIAIAVCVSKMSIRTMLVDKVVTALFTTESVLSNRIETFLRKL